MTFTNKNIENYNRLNAIKNTYSHFHSVRDLCTRIEIGTDPTNDILEAYFNNGFILENYNDKLSAEKLDLLEDRLESLRLLRETFDFNDELNWLCVVSDNLTREKSYNEDAIAPFIEPFVDTGQDRIADPLSRGIIEDLQDMMLRFPKNENLVKLCSWLESMLININFNKQGVIASWEISGLGQAVAHSKADLVKIQRALNFIHSVRYDNRMLHRVKQDNQTQYVECMPYEELDWVCDMASYVVSILPNVEDKLDQFCTDACQEQVWPFSIWRKYKIMPVFETEYPILGGLPETTSRH